MSTSNIPYKIYLSENEIPKAWYNLRADMKNKPAPLLDPVTHKPMTAEDLAGVFCEQLIAQELDDTTDTTGTDEITTPEETLYPWDPN